MGSSHVSTANRDNRAMSHRITERNFQRKRNKIRDSPKTNRQPEPKQFGSDSEQFNGNKRDPSTLITLSTFLLVLISVLVFTLLH